MASETISTNMGMPIPGVGTTAGPTWASDINASLTIIDSHDHGSGSGVQITPNGLNINADLAFASNSATGLKKTAFNSQLAALTGTNFLSFINGNLYANDGSGNQIPITSGGGVAGSPGSIGSLASPAAATYSAGSKLFTWTADSAKAAAMDNGAVTIRETNVASAKGITLASPSSLAADYQLTLPTALPAATRYVASSSSGVLSFATAASILTAGVVPVSWTPTVTVSSGSVSAFSISSWYYIVGSLCFFASEIAINSISAGNRAIIVSMPANMETLLASNQMWGTGRFQDASTNNNYSLAVISNDDSPNINMSVFPMFGSMTGIDIAASDRFGLIGFYQLA